MSGNVTIAALLLVVGFGMWAAFRVWRARRKKALAETTDYYGQM